jgi:hypothetical protein
MPSVTSAPDSGSGHAADLARPRGAPVAQLVADDSKRRNSSTAGLKAASSSGRLASLADGRSHF